MRKILLFSIPLLLVACANHPIVKPLEQTQLDQMSCRALFKESEKLNLLINQINHGNKPVVGGSTQEHKAEAAKAAQKRLNQVREASVQRMCTFG